MENNHARRVDWIYLWRAMDVIRGSIGRDRPAINGHLDTRGQTHNILLLCFVKHFLIGYSLNRLCLFTCNTHVASMCLWKYVDKERVRRVISNYNHYNCRKCLWRRLRTRITPENGRLVTFIRARKSRTRRTATANRFSTQNFIAVIII